MKAVAIIQARMGSSRLPGKVMKTLCGHSVLSHVIRRVKTSTGTREVIVATTTLPLDDIVAKEAAQLGVGVFRGSESDVLSRYRQAAQSYGPETILVRVTADCPLFDPTLLDEMLLEFRNALERKESLDYLSNTLDRTFPRGLDAEIFRLSALLKADREARNMYEREHVTPYIYRHPDLFSVRNFSGKSDRASLRWTLDTNEDWEVIQFIYQRLYREGRLFSTDEVYRLYEQEPWLVNVNAEVEQKGFA